LRISNFTNNFIDLIEENPENNEYFTELIPYLKNFNDELSSNYITKINNIIDSINDNKKYLMVQLFGKILKIQYGSTKYMTYNQIFNDDLYNVNLIDNNQYYNIVGFGNNGLKYKNLIDSNLSFFIIHPFEYDINKYRNKYNQIIDIKYNNMIKELNKKFINKLIRRSLQNLYLYIINKTDIYKVKIYKLLISQRKYSCK
jgi:hypothetical protein